MTMITSIDLPEARGAVTLGHRHRLERWRFRR
jgi:hypothetical protein